MLHIKGFLTRKDNEIIGIGSTEAADRDGEIIKQEGWDMENFNQNPVLLAHHNYHEFPIGKITEIIVEEGKLMFKAIFSEATQEAREAYQLVKEGILNAFSVGFIPKEYDPKDRSIITKAELLEISMVTVPANPQAIVLAKSFDGNKLAEKLIAEWMKDELLAKEVKNIETAMEAENNIEVEVDLKELKPIDCECGKHFHLKFTPQPETENKGEQGEGRAEFEVSDLLLKKTVGNLQAILEKRNRKEDRK